MYGFCNLVGRMREGRRALLGRSNCADIRGKEFFKTSAVCTTAASSGIPPRSSKGSTTPLGPAYPSEESENASNSSTDAVDNPQPVKCAQSSAIKSQTLRCVAVDGALVCSGTRPA